MISLMRDAMLRVSEAASLRWDDLTTELDGTGRLVLRRSKTDVEGETTVMFVSRPTMVDLERVRAIASDRGSMFGLSADQISRRIKNAALESGLGEGFSGHSPRVGMAQDLARAGTELPRLMTAGRWRSPRVPAHYIRNETAARGAVAQYYGHPVGALPGLTVAPNRTAAEASEVVRRHSAPGHAETTRTTDATEGGESVTGRTVSEKGSLPAENAIEFPITATISEGSSHTQIEAETYRGNLNHNVGSVPFRKGQERSEEKRTFFEGSDQILAQRRNRRLLPSLRPIRGDVSSILQSIRRSETRRWRRFLTNIARSLNLESQQHPRTANISARKAVDSAWQSHPATSRTAALGWTGIKGQLRRREIRTERWLTIPSRGHPFGDHESLKPSLCSEAPGTFTVSWDEVAPKPSEYRVNWAKSDEPFPRYNQSQGNAYPVENGLTVKELVSGRDIQGARPQTLHQTGQTERDPRPLVWSRADRCDGRQADRRQIKPREMRLNLNSTIDQVQLRNLSVATSFPFL